MIWIWMYCLLWTPNLPEYDGEPIDLMGYQTFDLYAGSELLGKNLDGRDITAQISGRPGPWRLETSIRIPKAIRDSQDIWLFLKTNIPATEVSFNGHLILENGSVGQSAASETLGKYHVLTRIPRNFIKTGDAGRDLNRIKVRCSNFSIPKGGSLYDLSLGPADLGEIKTGPNIYGPLLLCGVFLLAICINLSFYVAFKRQAVFLVLVGLFAVCFWTMAETIFLSKFHVDVAFRHHWVFGLKLDYATFLLLILALCFEFQTQLKSLPARNLYTGLALMGLGLWMIADHQLNFFWISLIPLALTIWAWRRGATGALLITASLLLHSGLVFLDESNLLDFVADSQRNFVVVSLIYYLDYVGFSIFAFAMVVASARGMIQRQRALDGALLKSARLEVELLRKHIQPHFLMNSLMSLQHLITTDQNTAVSMVDALSDEFQLMRTTSKHKLISLEEELDLCRIHLKIMSMQQRADFHLEVAGLAGDEQIPPAVFHTLIENGLTHGYSGEQGGRFLLTKDQNKDRIRYRLFNEMSQTVTEQTGSGTGFDYVKARLEESYPGRWRLQSQPVEGGWEVVMEIETC